MKKTLPATLVLIAVLAGAAAAQDAPAKGPADPLWELYKQGRFDEVVNQGKALLSTGTETAQVNLAVGRALVDQDKAAEGEIFLKRAADLDLTDRTWVYAWAEVYLGAVRLRLGDDDGARAAWLAARDCNATANATRNANNNLTGFALDPSFDKWDTFRTEHFLFRFSDKLTDFDRADYARRHEEAYAKIRAWFGGAPDQPIRFVVWADQDEATAAGMPTLGFARPRLDLVHCLVNQTVGHEMAHVIGYAAVHPVNATGLINEGTAVYLDQTGRDRMAVAEAALAAARADTSAVLPPFSVRALWDDWSLAPDGVSYPLAGAWVARLVEKGGKDRFLQFYVDQSRDHAKEVYGADLEGWIDGFEQDLGV